MFTVLSDFDCDCTVYITQKGYMAASFYCSFLFLGKAKYMYSCTVNINRIATQGESLVKYYHENDVM